MTTTYSELLGRYVCDVIAEDGTHEYFLGLNRLEVFTDALVWAMLGYQRSAWPMVEEFIA